MLKSFLKALKLGTVFGFEVLFVWVFSLNGCLKTSYFGMWVSESSLCSLDIYCGGLPSSASCFWVIRQDGGGKVGPLHMCFIFKIKEHSLNFVLVVTLYNYL